MIKEGGQITFLVIIVSAVVLFSVLLIVGGAQLYYSNAQYSAEEEKALALAEAGIDKAIATLNKTGGSWNGEGLGTDGVALGVSGDGEYAVKVTTKDAGTKILEATGYLPNKASPKVRRTIKIEAALGVGISFVYGIQVGEGGLDLNSNNVVQGSVYSNGPVLMNSNNEITGDVWVAKSPAINPDQETDCVGVNCVDFIFGKEVSGEERLDVAMSFKPSITERLSKVSIKIKKVGTPVDAVVRVMEDDNGQPKKSGVIASGTLYTNLVTQGFNFVDVTFDKSPQLDSDKSYWLMVDTITDNQNYWIWQNDLAGSYNSGSPKWSFNWNTGNPTWNSFSGDLSFKIYLGGIINALKGNSNTVIKGNVHANTIERISTIKGDAYYQAISDSNVQGELFPGSEDPPPKTFPISEGNITDWKEQAEGSGVEVGDKYIDQDDCPLTWESKKIVGDVYFNSNCTATFKSPLWITGNLNLNSNITLKLHPDFGASSGVVIVDGIVEVNSNNKLEGTGVGNSLVMALSTYDSRSNDVAAIKIISNGNTGVFYADKGIIEPGSNNTFKELTGWKIRLATNSIINYEQGLSSTLFSSGPSGSYSLVKGTYQVK